VLTLAGWTIRLSTTGTASNYNPSKYPLIVGVQLNGTQLHPVIVNDFQFHFIYDPHTLTSFTPPSPDPPMPVFLPPALLPVEPKRMPVQLIDEEEKVKVKYFALKNVKEEEEKSDEADEPFEPSPFLSPCPICLEIPFPPFKSLTCGHAICPECFATQQKDEKTRNTCSECRQKVDNKLVPQLQLTNMAKSLSLKMKCRHEGCGKVVDCDKAKAHHDSCQHQAKPCPFHRHSTGHCSWIGRANELMDHCMRQHHGIDMDTIDEWAFDLSFLRRQWIIWKPGKVAFYCYTAGFGFAFLALSNQPVPIVLTVNVPQGHMHATLKFRCHPAFEFERQTLVELPLERSQNDMQLTMTLATAEEQPKKRAREEEEAGAPSPPMKRPRVEEEKDKIVYHDSSDEETNDMLLSALKEMVTVSRLQTGKEEPLLLSDDVVMSIIQ
jgi:hypothetical protein